MSSCGLTTYIGVCVYFVHVQIHTQTDRHTDLKISWNLPLKRKMHALLYNFSKFKLVLILRLKALGVKNRVWIRWDMT